MNTDRLTSMVHFVQIVETGSFSAAARELGKTLPALSRSLRALEDRLGARLLTRTTRAIALTEFGQQYFEHCRRILRDIEEAEGLANETGRTVQGLVRISVPLMFGRIHVAPRVASLVQKHPRLQIDLQFTDRTTSMVDEGIDLAIRVGDLDDSSLIAVPIGHVTRVVCASPAYWKAHGTPQHPRDLKQHHCLTFRGLNQERGWLLRVEDEERYWPINTGFYSNEGSAIIRVACDGGGIAQMMSYQLIGEFHSGKLTAALQDFTAHSLPIHAVYPGGRLLPAKVRAVLDEWVPALRIALSNIDGTAGIKSI